jgi:zinc/manganese transport system substrate-binding protein
MVRLIFILAIVTAALRAEPLKVAAFHPLLAELAREVGGDSVSVVSLMNATGDPHQFEPSPQNLKEASGAKVYIVAGMGLESYLSALKSIIPDGSRLIEVGATLPPLLSAGHDEHCTHDHAAHELDPHWWHSIDRFRRATSIVSEAMSHADPESRDLYRARAEAYRAKLDRLEAWTRIQVAKIPKDRRRLATAHSAFNYFCADFGFTPFSIQGLSHEQETNPGALAKLISGLKEERVAALFPEKESNPKILSVLTQDTGIRMGEPLIADGANGMGYDDMIRHNVSAIVKGLTGP